MIKRFLQAEITANLKEFPAVAILGARQVGKTTLAKQIADIQKKNTLYLDLENPLDYRKLEDAYTFLTENDDKCIIIDEVQTMPSIFSVLRSAIDAKRVNSRFILLGSASPQLVKGVSESLAGRIAYQELSPINLSELPEKSKLNKHWFRGGFPGALLARSDTAAMTWMSGFVRSYIERDLGSLFGVALSQSTISRLMSMLAHVNGSTWNAEIISRSLGVSAPTVNRYVDFLEGAFLVHRLPAFYINAGKRLVKAPKVYIRDSGLLHNLCDLPNINSLKGHPVVGSSWEGYVVEQLHQLIPNNIKLYYYRTQAGAECDVVFVKGITPIACAEIKLSNAPSISKGYFQSIEDLGTKKNFVIVPDTEEYKTKDEVIICGLRVFIKKYLSKLK